VRARAEAPHSKATYNLAIEAWENGHLEEALRALESLTPDIGPVRGFLPYWGALANVHHLLGDYRAALAVARRAREVHPGTWWPVWWELAAMAALGQVDAVVARAAEMVRARRCHAVVAAKPWRRQQRAHGHARRPGPGMRRSVVPARNAVLGRATDKVGPRRSTLERYGDAGRQLGRSTPSSEDVFVLGLVGRVSARPGSTTAASRSPHGAG
jgi:hypothetical protein